MNTSETVTITRNIGYGLNLDVECIITDDTPVELYHVGDVGQAKDGACYDLTEDEQVDAHALALDLRDSRRADRDADAEAADEARREDAWWARQQQ